MNEEVWPLGQRMRFWLLFAVAAGLGLVIAWVDSRPTWDDAGITAGAILLTAAAFGAAWPARAWLWALAVGGWVPLIAIAQHSNYASLLALGVAFAGAYAGAVGRKAMRAPSPAKPPAQPPS